MALRQVSSSEFIIIPATNRPPKTTAEVSKLVFPNFLISIIFSLVRIYDDGIVMLLMENYLIANFITQSLTRRCSTLLTDQNIEILDVSTTFR